MYAINCITKTDGTVDDAEDLDLVMAMYNMLEYSSNYSNTRGSSWFYSKDEATNFNNDIADSNNFKSLLCKTKLLRKTEAERANGILKNTTIVVPLKNLSNFWRSLEMPLINCKVELKRKWKNHCLLPGKNNDNDDAHSNNIILTINFLAKDLTNRLLE